MSVVTKLANMMTYLECLLPTNSHDRVIKYSCKIKRQIKMLLYSLTQCL